MHGPKPDQLIPEQKTSENSSPATSPHVIEVKENTQGCDFVMGDLHGTLFIKDWVRRAGPYDRLFVTGDLTDRGPFSARVLDFIISDNKQRQEDGLPQRIYVVMGNHEVWLLNSIIYLLNKESYDTELQSLNCSTKTKLIIDNYKAHLKDHNGGGWLPEMLKKMTQDKQKETLSRYKHFIESLPYIIYVNGKYPFIVVHAWMPLTDEELMSMLHSKESKLPLLTDQQILQATWSRWSRPTARTINSILYYHGHLVMNKNHFEVYDLAIPVKPGINAVNVDCGAYADYILIVINHTRANYTIYTQDFYNSLIHPAFEYIASKITVYLVCSRMWKAAQSVPSTYLAGDIDFSKDLDRFLLFTSDNPAAWKSNMRWILNARRTLLSIHTSPEALGLLFMVHAETIFSCGCDTEVRQQAIDQAYVLLQQQTSTAFFNTTIKPKFLEAAKSNFLRYKNDVHNTNCFNDFRTTFNFLSPLIEGKKDNQSIATFIYHTDNTLRLNAGSECKDAMEMLSTERYTEAKPLFESAGGKLRSMEEENKTNNDQSLLRQVDSSLVCIEGIALFNTGNYQGAVDSFTRARQELKLPSSSISNDDPVSMCINAHMQCIDAKQNIPTAIRHYQQCNFSAAKELWTSIRQNHLSLRLPENNADLMQCNHYLTRIHADELVIAGCAHFHSGNYQSAATAFAQAMQQLRDVPQQSGEDMTHLSTWQGYLFSSEIFAETQRLTAQADRALENKEYLEASKLYQSALSKLKESRDRSFPPKPEIATSSVTKEEEKVSPAQPLVPQTPSYFIHNDPFLFATKQQAKLEHATKQTEIKQLLDTANDYYKAKKYKAAYDVCLFLQKRLLVLTQLEFTVDPGCQACNLHWKDALQENARLLANIDTAHRNTISNLISGLTGQSAASIENACVSLNNRPNNGYLLRFPCIHTTGNMLAWLKNFGLVAGRHFYYSSTTPKTIFIFPAAIPLLQQRQDDTIARIKQYKEKREANPEQYKHYFLWMGVGESKKDKLAAADHYIESLQTGNLDVLTDKDVSMLSSGELADAVNGRVPSR